MSVILFRHKGVKLHPLYAKSALYNHHKPTIHTHTLRYYPQIWRKICYIIYNIIGPSPQLRIVFRQEGGLDAWPKWRQHMRLISSSMHLLACVPLLTLNVQGPSYPGLTWSISWLLMPWLLTSPEHRQPWYWLCKIGRFLSYLRKDFNYLRLINVEKWQKM